MLDKDSPIPLYYQLAEHLKEQIHAKELLAGAQIPPERELAQQMAVSRMTARQAVAYLVNEGLLEVKPGVGTFVAQPKLTHNALHLLGFSEEMARVGITVGSTVLRQELTRPPKPIAEQLQLAAHEQVVTIVRLRQVEQTPLLLETSCLPARLCPGLEALDLTGRSLYTLLETQYHLLGYRATQTIEATTITPYEQQLFQLAAGTAMLLLEGVAYDQHDRPFEYFKAVYRGDRFTFMLKSQRNGAETATNATIVPSRLAEHATRSVAPSKQRR
ncbi:MAG: GntR family transcriptional regulator [Caldilineaceae bacterium]|nr:GntR family transcriptional regulator [Caldilineaceae bacterium]